MTTRDVSQTKDEKTRIIAAAALCGVLVAVFFAVPLVLGAGLWFALRKRLARREWIIMAVASTVATVFTFAGTFSRYANWTKDLFFGGDRLAVPWFTVIVLSLLVASVLGAISDTRLVATLQTKMRRKGDDEIIPDERELARIEQVRAPIGDVVVGSHQHGLIAGAEIGKRGLPIGIDRNGKPAVVTEDELKTHAVVLGATGSGKTEALKSIAGGLLDLGWQVVAVDLKEDTAAGGFRDFLRRYSHNHAQYYQELAISVPSGRYWFNPLYGMSPDEAINAILSLQSFDDGYWQAINRTMIGQVVTLFYDCHRIDPATYPAPDMYTIATVLRSPDIKNATKDMRGLAVSSIPERTPENFSSLGKPSEDDRKSAAGLGSRIINMYESEAGRQVLREGNGRQVMDVTQPGVCYIGLNTLGMSELARVVSTSVLLRLAALAGQRTTGAVEKGNTRIAVIIDEANWIDRTQVQNLLSRARSAGVSVILATQGANDFNDENGQDWEKIVNNVNVGIVMRQGGPESAELCADFIGKYNKTSLVSQVLEGDRTGLATERVSEEYRVAPDKLRELLVGQAIIRVGTPKQRIEWVKMYQRDPDMDASGNIRRGVSPPPVTTPRMPHDMGPHGGSGMLPQGAPPGGSWLGGHGTGSDPAQMPGHLVRPGVHPPAPQSPSTPPQAAAPAPGMHPPEPTPSAAPAPPRPTPPADDDGWVTL